MKFNLNQFILITLGTLLYAVLSAKLNNAQNVRTDLGAVLIFGFITGLLFLVVCVMTHVMVMGFSIPQGMVGVFVSFIIFTLLYLLIDLIFPLQFLQSHEYYETLWSFVFMLFYFSDILYGVLALPSLRKNKELNERLQKAREKK